MSDIANTLMQILNMEEPDPNTNIVTDLPAPIEEANTLPAIIEEEQHTPESDLKFAKDNIRDAIRDSAGAISELLQIAKGSEHPRAYEVLGDFLKTFAEINKDLVELSRTNIKEDKTPVSSNTIVHADKAVFVGSTAQLGEMLKQRPAAPDANNIPEQPQS